MNNIITNISQFLDNIMSNIKAMGYSIYVVLAVILLLLLFMLISRKHKWLLWILFIITAALSAYMLYYVIMGDQILLFIQAHKFLNSFNNLFLIIAGALFLLVIVLIAIISLILGKKKA
ncbi:MAG: hypothetical protein KAQ68_07745 [Clostridiales bacterium]|nr:hypothetical protein [Clostridiales bacterium]